MTEKLWWDLALDSQKTSRDESFDRIGRYGYRVRMSEHRVL